MASKVGICNMALAKFGEARILDLTEDSEPARTCSLFYDVTRDAALRDGVWNFARKRQTLSALSAAPNHGFTYQYQLPGDFIRLLSLNDLDENSPRTIWEIEDGKILTDDDSAKIVYTYRNDDPASYDALFVDAFAILLAARIVTNLTGSQSLERQYVEEYERLAAVKARRRDGAESSPYRPKIWKITRNSAFVNSRRGYTLG